MHCLAYFNACEHEYEYNQLNIADVDENPPDNNMLSFNNGRCKQNENP